MWSRPFDQWPNKRFRGQTNGFEGAYRLWIGKHIMHQSRACYCSDLLTMVQRHLCRSRCSATLNKVRSALAGERPDRWSNGAAAAPPLPSKRRCASLLPIIAPYRAVTFDP